MIGNPSEAEISGEHAKQIEDNQERRGSHNAKAAPALLDRKRQVGWKPCKQTPPAKHPEEVEQQQSGCALEIGSAKDSHERRIPLSPLCSLWFKLLTFVDEAESPILFP